MITTSSKKLVENEAMFRQKNEAVNRDVATLEQIEADALKPNFKLQYHCECADEGCQERITLTVKRYKQIHAERDRFIIIPGHNVAKVENIVKRYKAFDVVDKKLAVPKHPDRLHKTDVHNTK